MDDPLQHLIASRDVAILDGGLATELERRGLVLDDALWSALALDEAPEQIAGVHLDYYRAGADIAISASYQATFAGFAARGIGHAAAARLMQRSVQLVRQAREAFLQTPAAAQRPAPLVAASVGCYGAALHDGSEYRGDYGLSHRELVTFHRERLAVLIDAGPDLLACETIPCLAEAEALVELLEASTPPPAWLSFACRDGERVAAGQPLAQCAALAERCAKVVAVGVNCTAPRHVESLLRHAARTTTKPLVAYPNSGEHWDAARRAWQPAADEVTIPAAAPAWRRAGARLIGGCCRTTPETIRALAAALGRG
jgi:homocysteine S-methyltransferase